MNLGAVMPVAGVVDDAGSVGYLELRGRRFERFPFENCPSCHRTVGIELSTEVAITPLSASRLAAVTALL